MKRFKAFTSLMIAGVMMFSMAACTPKTTNDEVSSTETEVITTAKEKLTEVKDFKSVIDYTMVSTSDGVTSTTAVNVDVTSTESPYAMHMVRTVTASAEGYEDTSAVSDMYANQIDDTTYTLFMDLNDVWYKQEVDGATVAYTTSSFKSLNTMKTIFNFAKDFTEVGTEEVNSKEAIRFDGTIDKAALSTIIKSGNMLEYIQISELDDSFLDGIESEVISVWIDKETNLPVKYSLNLANVVNNIFTLLIKSLVEEQGADPAEIGTLSIEDFTVSAVLFDMDNVEEIVIPDQVLSAEEFVAEDYIAE